MSVRAWKRMCRRISPRGACAVTLLLLGVVVLLIPPSPPLVTTARFPDVTPRRLAHMLADFSTHLRLYPHLGEWAIEEEKSNYTAWRYTVSYSCGARCQGRARILAIDEHAGGGTPAHGIPRAHRVLVAHRSCTSPPVIPWPSVCDEWDTETQVVGDGAGGAVMSERARGACGGWAGILRRFLPSFFPLSCQSELRSRRDQHLVRLRAMLAEELAS